MILTWLQKKAWFTDTEIMSEMVQNHEVQNTWIRMVQHLTGKNDTEILLKAVGHQWSTLWWGSCTTVQIITPAGRWWQNASNKCDRNSHGYTVVLNSQGDHFLDKHIIGPSLCSHISHMDSQGWWTPYTIKIPAATPLFSRSRNAKMPQPTAYQAT